MTKLGLCWESKGKVLNKGKNSNMIHIKKSKKELHKHFNRWRKSIWYNNIHSWPRSVTKQEIRDRSPKLANSPLFVPSSIHWENTQQGCYGDCMKYQFSFLAYSRCSGNVFVSVSLDRCDTRAQFLVTEGPEDARWEGCFSLSLSFRSSKPRVVSPAWKNLWEDLMWWGNYSSWHRVGALGSSSSCLLCPQHCLKWCFLGPALAVDLYRAIHTLSPAPIPESGSRLWMCWDGGGGRWRWGLGWRVHLLTWVQGAPPLPSWVTSGTSLSFSEPLLPPLESGSNSDTFNLWLWVHPNLWFLDRSHNWKFLL